MTQFFHIHSENPQPYLLRQAVTILRHGGVIVYPTDSGYALGCQLGNKEAIDRMRRIRQLDEKHHFTLVCRDLSDISTYARLDTATYRILKTLTPGPYTFLLKATNEVPRRLVHAKRKTIGIRVPDNTIALSLLDMLEEPIISTTLILPGQEVPLIEPEVIVDMLGQRIELVIGGGYCGLEQTTVIDLSGEAPRVVRRGKGDPTPFLVPTE
jgi:tRNA threonylcarbamoyl adenosine modification protein (Sua5/YciO/YrdC/YwlC family)